MVHYPLSLLDRLLDDDPDAAFEDQPGDALALDRFKLGLRRDLEGLLNARQPFAPWTQRHPALAATITGFGLPDLSTEDFSTPTVRERIRRLIAAAIRTHEPRLQGVEVEVDGAPTSAGVRFRIFGLVRIDDTEEPVAYDARLRPTDRIIAVALAG